MNNYQKEVYRQTIKDAIGTEKLTTFALRAGLSAGNLSRIRNGQPATPETLKKIADASAAVTYAELMEAAGYSGGLAAAPEEPPLRKMISVPHVRELKEPKTALKQDPTLKRSLVEESAVGPGDYIFFEVRDDALRKLSPGDTVLVDMAKEPADGDIALLLLEETEPLLRRVTKSGGKYLIYGDDLSRYPMTSADIGGVTVYGVVVRAITRP